MPSAPRYIASYAQATGRGIFILFSPPPVVLKPQGTGRVAALFALPWGPANTLTPYLTALDFRNKFCPDGCDRTNTGYLMATRFAFSDLSIVRVQATNAVAAFVQLSDVAPANALLLTAKYKSSMGNRIVARVDPASDPLAPATSFNLTVTMTDPVTALATTETYLNVDSTKAIGSSYWTTLVAKSNLLAVPVKGAGARPVNGSFPMTTGSDGVPSVANYIGTQGSADQGCAVLEGDTTINFVLPDVPPVASIAAINAGLASHQVYMADQRRVVLSGSFGDTVATATANALLRAGQQNVDYVYDSCAVYGDDGNLYSIPLTAAYVSICTIIPASISPAYKASEYTAYLGNIVSLGTPLSSSAKTSLETANVVCFEKNSDGTFSPYDDVGCDGVPIYVERMQWLIASSIAGKLEHSKNAPNAAPVITSERVVIQTTLKGLKDDFAQDSTHKAGIVDFNLMPVEQTNTAAQIAAGDITHGYNVQLAAAQKRIFLLSVVGTTVTITPPVGG